MYARFFRWASDRLDTNGVLAFVTNRSFIDRRTFDGFRKTVAQEFNEIRIVDLGGDVRANPKLSGTKHNVFGIQTGVAISFLIKRSGSKGRCRIFYTRRPEFETADEKLAFLSTAKLESLAVEEIHPDERGHWLNLTDNGFEKLLPIASKKTKATTKRRAEQAIFKLYSLGISTNRDEWLYDLSPDTLKKKIRALIRGYEAHKQGSSEFSDDIKWSETLKRRAQSGTREAFNINRVVRSAYRPFFSPYIYQSELFIDRPGASAKMFHPGATNQAICFSDVGARTQFAALAIGGIADLHFGSAIDGYQQIPLYLFEEDGTRVDNITDWALARFVENYKAGTDKRQPKPTKEGIFKYVYAVLHDPIYREKYAYNLKRDFPRIPLYGSTRADFWRWAEWGQRLLELHIGYEQVKPYPLKRTDVTDTKAIAAGLAPKCVLKADPVAGRIVLDSETMLAGIPGEAWTYVLGSRSAIEWVLDQYKERKPKDQKIRENFDTYCFDDHKEHVIELLARVTRISVETIRIIEELKNLPRENTANETIAL
jgi:predicted helicase